MSVAPAMPGGAPAPSPLPLLALPGFMPDAVGYSARLTLAMLGAYLVSFALQLESASSAGVCVGIVMQASPGMAVSKAFYRTAGTLVGGAAALLIDGFFPQDRSMLLLATAGWVAACTFAASFLRDFRAYGAVLAGYTVAVIAIGQIDTPGNVLVATLNRVAAILVGILCVALVNAVFASTSAHAHLVAELRRHLRQQRDAARDVLTGADGPVRDVWLDRAADLMALRTEAAYASAELADGLRRNRAATAAVAALLDMSAASSELARAMATGMDGVAPGTRGFLRVVAAGLETGVEPPLPQGLPPTPQDALLMERAAALARDGAEAGRAVAGAETGVTAGLPRRVRIPMDPDTTGAVLNAVRAAAATGLGAVLCIMGSDPGTTLLLIQLAAFVALLGLQPNPSAAAAAFLPGAPFAVALAALVVFGLLPLASGTVPFALAVGPAVFAIGLAARHPRTARFTPGMLIYFTILLSPSNQQTFDASAFANLVLQLAAASVLTVAAFRLLLPVDPRRRLIRVGDRVGRSLRRALQGRPAAPDGLGRPTLAFDRLGQARQWSLARRPGGPHPVLTRLCQLAELDAAARRATWGLREAVAGAPGLRPLAGAAQDGLARVDAGAVDAAARALLAHGDAEKVAGAVLHAVSGLHGTALLLRCAGPALPRYGVTGRHGREDG